ncbi:MAG: hypothetical protein F2789_07655 [Actinobacteria bacterium]|nr:hypothetical protein [Actinomycetota bacterium]
MHSQTTTWLTRVMMAFVAVTAVVAWIGVGELGGSSSAGLRATETALDHAVGLADATATLGVQVQQAMTTLGNGMGSAAEAMDHTVAVSRDVRALLDTLAPLGAQLGTDAPARLADLVTSLGQAEASLQEVQGGMNETQANLVAAAPAFAEVVTRLQAVPDELRAARARVHASAVSVGRGVVLLRIAITVGALMVLLRSALARRTGQP